MNELLRDILQCIGNTSLLGLRHIVPKNAAPILLKLENENSTGLVVPKPIEAGETTTRQDLDRLV